MCLGGEILPALRGEEDDVVRKSAAVAEVIVAVTGTLVPRLLSLPALLILPEFSFWSAGWTGASGGGGGGAGSGGLFTTREVVDGADVLLGGGDRDRSDIGESDRQSRSQSSGVMRLPPDVLLPPAAPSCRCGCI